MKVMRTKSARKNEDIIQAFQLTIASSTRPLTCPLPLKTAPEKSQIIAIISYYFTIFQKQHQPPMFMFNKHKSPASCATTNYRVSTFSHGISFCRGTAFRSLNSIVMKIRFASLKRDGNFFEGNGKL